MDDPFKRALVAVDFAMPDGSRLTRSWSTFDPDMERFTEVFRSPPDWLDAPNRSWPHPRGPILFGGLVREGREDEARKAVHGG